MNRSPHPQRAGIALVLVLSFLALITVLVLAFFSSVTTELASTGAAADAATTRQLADSAVNVVMTQLVDGSKGVDANGSILAWATQPGMLRTYNAQGAPALYYKLYSSDKMVVSGTTFNINNEPPPGDWNAAANSEIYTDLNAPVADAQGNLIYPVVDPSADGTPPSASNSATSNSGTFDPKDTLKVDGFAIDSQKTPGYTSGNPAGIGNSRAPMPVRWLYMLQDGTLVPGTVGADHTATVTGATKVNPIVGRIAFWADDDTTKVNINTASEGTYWDVPRIYSQEDMGGYAGATSTPQFPSLAICQPFQHEFQRYPGHPATTCLSPVLGNLLPVKYPYPPNPSGTNAAQLEPYYNLTPRVGLSGLKGGGGSLGGTVQEPSSNAAITTDTDRLYASVDELMFTPMLTSPHARIPNTSQGSALPAKITKHALEQAKFFLTANSNAPEITLFNTPRVAIWPVWDTTAPYKRTPFDDLMAFCSTIGPGKSTNAYYLTRKNSRSMTDDYAGRNVDLYRYLQAMTGANIPGFGGNFLKKYGAGSLGPTDRDQILTYIYDYIRCTSLQDRSNGATPYTRNTNGTPSYFNGSQGGSGEVMPIRINQTQGFGRFYSISQASLLFYGSRQQVPKSGAPATNKAGAMRAVLYFQFASPQQGLGCFRASLKYRVRGLEKFNVTIGTGQPQSLRFPTVDAKHTLINDLAVTDLSTWHGRSIGGSESPTQGLLNKVYYDLIEPPTPLPNLPLYQFLSTTDVPIQDASATTFVLKDNPSVQVDILNDDPAPQGVVQTITLHFPQGEFLLPTYVGATSKYNPAPYDFGAQVVAGSTNLLVNNNNTVVSMQVAGVLDLPTDTKATNDTAGDTRMVEGLQNVPAQRFHAHKDYFVKGTQFAHGTVMSVGETFTGGKYGRLANVPPLTGYLQNPEPGYATFHRQPDVPSRVVDSVMHVNPLSARDPSGPGDWDTGLGDQKDGAYINKPDEGDSALTDNVNGVIRIPYNLGYGAGFAAANQTYFSPTRQVPSPMMFGSIPTGVQRMMPWQTLLFHPRPEDPTHPGAISPKDELIADLFWMPVVEPWAISQPFATAGKINMNYQIVPFTYIKRQSGLYAVMKATKFAAIPTTDAPSYKPIDPSGRATSFNANRRHPIDIPKTLAAFDKLFSAGSIFKSATQICEIDLWPGDVKPSTMAAFWAQNGLTGDNLREKPYVDLYPRLTTKSNTFTVHVRVQALKKAPSTPVDQWVAGKDHVSGEYRGSSTLERYIDVNDPSLPDFAKLFDPTNPKLTNIDPYYKMRVVSTRQFRP